MQKVFGNRPIQALFILAISTAVGIVYNAVSQRGISLIGHWAVADSSGFVFPLSYEKGDSLVSLAEAIVKYQSQNTVFLDARYREDYELGHVRGAINLPFDDFYGVFPQVEASLSKDNEIITYCGEVDCDISLFLARLLRENAYERVMVMVQGWETWEKAGLPISKGPNP